MDCDNARLYLPFLTPGGKDLDGREAEELHRHLAECSACNALAMNTRRLDQHLGRAMRAVEVPGGEESHFGAAGGQPPRQVSALGEARQPLRGGRCWSAPCGLARLLFLVRPTGKRH